MKTAPDLDWVREYLSYDPETGVVVWRHRLMHGRIKPGCRAGYTGPDGRWGIGLLGKRYQLAKIIYYLVTGEWTDGLIDHRDGDPSNHQWKNLRPATLTQNNQNKARMSNNTSGYTGVRFRDNKWRAGIVANKVWYWANKHGFDTFEEAVEARKMLERKHHGEFAVCERP